MSGWWVRWRQRQTELADGVDADLVREHRRRWKLGFGLIGGAVLVALVTARLQLHGALRTVAMVVAAGLLIAGSAMTKWAMQEKYFLDRPDPEGRPSILKK